MDHKLNKIKEMMKKLFALKGRSPDPYVIGTWCEILKTFDVKAIAQACNNVLQKEGYFEIKILLDELRPSNKDIAISEWDEVLNVAKDGGKGLDKLSVEARRALNSAGGLRKLQYTDSQYAVDSMKKQFIESYSRKEIASNGENFFFVESNNKFPEELE
jgi:hypothetical protein